MRMVSRKLAALVLLAVIVSGCGGDSASAPTTPTEVARVRLIATVGPTATVDATLAAPTVPAATLPPTATPEPTAYIGQFLGEAPPAPDLSVIGPSEPLVVTTPGEGVNPLNCAIVPDAVFGAAWTNDARAFNGLRCPIQVSFGFESLSQVFESGVMYWREATNEVWAISPGGLAVNGEHWSLTQPPIAEQAAVAATLGVEVAEGRFLPEGALLGVWAGVPEAQSALGFALTPLQTVPVNLQRFEGGSLLLDVEAGQVFVLLVDGTAFGPF